jgi:hypothetical protein
VKAGLAYLVSTYDEQSRDWFGFCSMHAVYQRRSYKCGLGVVTAYHTDVNHRPVGTPIGLKDRSGRNANEDGTKYDAVAGSGWCKLGAWDQPNHRDSCPHKNEDQQYSNHHQGSTGTKSVPRKEKGCGPGTASWRANHLETKEDYCERITGLYTMQQVSLIVIPDLLAASH